MRPTFAAARLRVCHEPVKGVHVLGWNHMHTLSPNPLIDFQAFRHQPRPCDVLCYRDQPLCPIPAQKGVMGVQPL